MARVDVSWQNALIVTGLVVATLFAIKYVNQKFPNPLTGSIITMAY